MDDSLTNLMNESQSETSIYKFQIDISDEDRLNINRVLFTLSFKQAPSESKGLFLWV